MLYAMEGLAVPDDPYDLEGYPREVQKTVFNIMLNANSRISAIRATLGKGMKAVEVGQLIDQFEARHSKISKYLLSGIGIHLQFTDSCIAERVMLGMLAKGRTVLPMHDSFIMRIGLERELEEEMEKAFVEEFPGVPARLKAKETQLQEEGRKREEKGEERDQLLKPGDFDLAAYYSKYREFNS